MTASPKIEPKTDPLPPHKCFEAILREGFRDRNGLVGAYHAAIEGVFLADRPLDCNEGAKGDELLEIRLPDELDIFRL